MRGFSVVPPGPCWPINYRLRTEHGISLGDPLLLGLIPTKDEISIWKTIRMFQSGWKLTSPDKPALVGQLCFRLSLLLVWKPHESAVPNSSPKNKVLRTSNAIRKPMARLLHSLCANQGRRNLSHAKVTRKRNKTITVHIK